MNGAWPQAIHTARVPAHLAGEPRLRPGLERWLAGADPARHGLPGDALVLVRRLALRWPLLQAGDSARRYAPLGAVLAGACHAADAGPAAEAVWFADEAELLACLARDAGAGRLAERWWWQAVLQVHRSRSGAPTGPGGLTLARWLAAPRQVPRALQRLGPAQAQAWLAPLGRDGLAALVAALAQAYPLADDTAAWVLDGRPAPPRPPAVDRLPSRSADRPPAPALTPDRPAPEADAAAAARLARLCAALLTDAQAAATPVRLQQLATTHPSNDALAPAAPLRPPIEPAVARTTRDSAPTAHAAAAPTPPPTRGPASAWHTPRPDTPLVPRGAPPRTRQVALPAPPPPGSPPVHRPQAAVDAAPPASAAPALPSLTPPRCFDTAHGGLFFLLNAALALGWYGDFTQPRHPGLACSPWRLLLLAGQAWARPGWRHDPLRRQLQARSAGTRAPLPLPLWPALHARLAEALGPGDDDRPARARVHQLIALPAQVRDRGERLDVHYPLARLPLAVRLAGLDRDPGWIPAAGCDLRFHFD